MRCVCTLGLVLGLLAQVGCGSDPQAPQPARVAIAPAEVRLLAGDTVTLVATAYDGDNVVIAGATLWWETEDSVIVQVDSTGLVYGREPGLTNVIVAAGDAVGRVPIQVQAATTGWRTVDMSCGSWQDGNAYCWFWLNVPGPIAAPDPLPASPPLRVTRSGFGHRCGLTPNGEAYCWGENDYGQLGDGTMTDRQTPVAVVGGVRFDSISLGALHTCALTSEGRAYCWGGGRHGQLGVGTPPEVCGNIPCSRLPVPVSGSHRFRMIAAGGSDRIGFGSDGRGLTCALDDIGQVFCWGLNQSGGVGDGTRIDRDIPTRAAPGLTFVAIATGASHACGLDRVGRLYCWGSNNEGQLGVTLSLAQEDYCITADIFWPCTSVPVLVSIPERLRAVSTFSHTTCGLNWFGAALCWGYNYFGQAGTGTSGPDVKKPTRVMGNHTYVQLRVGESAVCGLTPSGVAECWGNLTPYPQRVPDPSGR